MLYKCGGERHGAFLPVFRAESPNRFGGHADQTIAKIHVTPSDMTNLPIPKTRGEQKLEKYAFILLRVFEKGSNLSRFVNGTYGVDVVGPVVRFNQFGLTVTFEKLEND